MIDDPHNGGSEIGAWAEALRYSVTIKVSEYPSEPTPAPTLGNYGAAVAHPFAAPVLSLSFHGDSYA